MAGRHGNKGVVSRVLPAEDMPFLPNGRPLDIVLNPLGVPSRMNIGQVKEIHLSLAAKALGFNVATPVFNGALEDDIADTLALANDYVNTPLTQEELMNKKADLEAQLADAKADLDKLSEQQGVVDSVSKEEADVAKNVEAGDAKVSDLLNATLKKAEEELELTEVEKKISDIEAKIKELDECVPFEDKYKDVLDPQVLDYLLNNADYRKQWEGVPINKDGKVRLRDGRTGEFFDGAVTVGFMHYLKLHHLVDDKIHARSTGPYSLVTQQPLGGKAQFGGQRFGEMEVWALEAYGAAYTLQEILTVKSDDVVGRVKTYEAIIKGDNISEPGIPESFKVLLKELQALALDVTVLDEAGNEIKMTESVEEHDSDADIKPLIDNEDNFAFGNDESFEAAGFTEGTAEELEEASFSALEE